MTKGSFVIGYVEVGTQFTTDGSRHSRKVLLIDLVDDRSPKPCSGLFGMKQRKLLVCCGTSRSVVVYYQRGCGAVVCVGPFNQSKPLVSRTFIVAGATAASEWSLCDM